MEVTFEAEKFIRLIKERPSIWNYKSPAYSNKEQRRNDWIEICKEMTPDFKKNRPTTQLAIICSFQKQWKVLRDGFLRALKNLRNGISKKPYTYYQELKFMISLYDLDDIDQKIEHSQSSDEHFEENASKESEALPVLTRRLGKRGSRGVKRSATPISKPEPKKPAMTPKTALVDVAKFLENDRSKQNMEKDDDQLFLMSLMKDFKAIPEELKLDAKVDILNVLKQYRNRGECSQASAWSSDIIASEYTIIKEDDESASFISIKCDVDDGTDEDL